jgi:ubiquinol-cytochrome c reductase cytochrome c subunit
MLFRSHASRLARTLAAFAAFGVCAALFGRLASAQPVPDAKRGYAAYVRDGCYECHGYQGQGNARRGVGGGGGEVGPILAPQPLPYQRFMRQVRTPRDLMPAYSSRILSNEDAADIYAYLRTISDAKAPSAIPLLTGVTRQPR